MNNKESYLKRTRLKIAVFSLLACIGFAYAGIHIGMRMGNANLVQASITAGITGVTTVALAYIGGDSFRSSYPTDNNGDINIYQGNSKDDFESKLDTYKSPI